MEIEIITGLNSEFLHHFLDNGRMSSIMKDFPLHVALRENLDLWGAHILASTMAADFINTISGYLP